MRGSRYNHVSFACRFFKRVYPKYCELNLVCVQDDTIKHLSYKWLVTYVFPQLYSDSRAKRIENILSQFQNLN